MLWFSLLISLLFCWSVSAQDTREILPGDILHGSVNSTNYDYYSYTPEKNLIQFDWIVTILEGNGHCTIYDNQSPYFPSTYYYTNSVDSIQGHAFFNETSFDGVRHDDIYYLAVYAPSTSPTKGCRYTVQLNLVPYSCPNNCSLHGHCYSESCSCDRGYDGYECQDRYDRLDRDDLMVGYVGGYGWNYYNILSEKPLIVWMNTTSDVVCELYTHKEYFPSQTVYESSNKHNVSVNKMIRMSVDKGDNVLWYIGVHGNGCQYSLIVQETEFNNWESASPILATIGLIVLIILAVVFLATLKFFLRRTVTICLLGTIEAVVVAGTKEDPKPYSSVSQNDEDVELQEYSTLAFEEDEEGGGNDEEEVSLKDQIEEDWNSDEK